MIKYETALSYAKLLFMLHKLQLLTNSEHRRLINHISVRTLAYQMKEESNGESSKDK